MPDLYTLVIAVFSSFGVIALVLLLIGRLLRPRKKATLFVAVNAETAGELENALQYISWLRHWSGASIRTVVLSDTLGCDGDLLAMLEREEVYGVCGSGELSGLISGFSENA